MLKRSLIVLMTLALVASLAVGCRPAGPEIGGVLVRSLTANPSLFNPILTTDTASTAVTGYLFQGMLRYDENMQRVGELAYDWEFSDDGLEWTFFLEEDVTWHDGEPFTSADVEFTIGTMAFNPDYPGVRASMFERVEEIRVVDDYTITFVLSDVYAPFMNNIGFDIIPKHIFDPEVSGVPMAELMTHPGNLDPIGTGPYVYGEWREGEYIDVLRNPDFWRSPEPYIETVMWRFIEDMSTAVAALEAGEIDMLAGIPDDELDRVLDGLADTHNFYEYQELSYDYFGFNFYDEPFVDHFGEDPGNPFHDLRVRQALTHALDRQGFIDDILQGRGTVMHSSIPPNSWAYSENVTQYAYDPEAAADLLDEAGWILRDGDTVRTWEDDADLELSFTLHVQQGNPRRDQITILAQEYWAEVGIDIDIIVVEWATLVNNHLLAKNFQLIIVGWLLSADPDATSIFRTGESFNVGGYSNPEVDRLLDLGVQVLDLDERAAVYGELAEELSTDLPYIFLLTRDLTTAVDKKVMDITVGALGLWWFERWYISE